MEGQAAHDDHSGRFAGRDPRLLFHPPLVGLAEENVRVTNPDVGGGFGMKAMGYPEYFAVAQAARVLGQPVKWFAERTESMLSDNGGRDLVSCCEMAFDADLKMVGYRVGMNGLGRLGLVLEQDGQDVLRLEGRHARRHVVEHGAQTVDVGADIHLAVHH